MADMVQVPRADWNWVVDKVNHHDREIKELRRTTVNIEVSLHELSKWKEDSKVQEIAALKGQIKRYSRVRDRILYTLALGAVLEGVRLLIDHFVGKLH